MQITLSCGDNIASVEVPADATLADLAAAVAAATGVPAGRATLMKDGAPLAGAPTTPAAAAGVADGDVLAVIVDGGGGGGGGGGSAAAPNLFSDPSLLARLAASLPRAPGSAPAPPPQPRSADPRAAAAAAVAAEIDALNADAFNSEAQKKIEELLRRQAVEANYEAAVEHAPEAFGDVVMLYVNLTVNGVPMKAFVDSGAQRTIMSLADANVCGIARLIDDRFAGTARGVGSGKIVGRVHSVPVGAAGGGASSSSFFPLAITIMEDSSMPFLLGLDALRAHRATIDVGPANCLRFPELGVALPFLAEHELPPSARAGATFAGEGGTPSSAPTSTAAPDAAAAARLTGLAPTITPAAAAAALARAGGNEEVAAAMLFEGMG